jgi:uncharacterized protein (DUF885 family)
MAAAVLFSQASPHRASTQEAAEQVERLADAYVSSQLNYDPTIAYSTGLDSPSHSRFADRTPRALNELHAQSDQILAKLKTIDATLVAGTHAEQTNAVLRETLESAQALRVCRAELWDVNQMQGWQVELVGIAEAQPVGTPEQRKAALQRWETFPRYLQVEISNLRTGLAAGYSAPKTVVQRVLEQLDGLTPESPEASPFFSPAKRANDSAFIHAFRNLVANRITPAIQEYKKFLQTEYLPHARESLGLSSLPQGAACYQAYLRRYTTTRRTPKEIYELGLATVDKSVAEVREIGSRLFGTSDFSEIVSKSLAAPANHFASKEELLAFSRDLIPESRAKSAPLFFDIPNQMVEIQPLPQYQEGSGVSSHYEANANPKEAATFWIALAQWDHETRGAAEITVVHETVPGHHLQVSAAQRLGSPTRLAKLSFNSAYVEGWANYAERLSEESGIDGDDYERLHRRIFYGRSLVIDPGIHAFEWSRERAEEYAMQAGMTKGDADEVIDRIAVEPGQLTSYETGGLEILALREEARKKLADQFDIRAFHQRVLELGILPLSALRSQIVAWFNSQDVVAPKKNP